MCLPFSSARLWLLLNIVKVCFRYLLVLVGGWSARGMFRAKYVCSLCYELVIYNPIGDNLVRYNLLSYGVTARKSLKPGFVVSEGKRSASLRTS